MENKPIAIAIHGGAGTISRSNMTAEMEEKYIKTLELICDSGYKVLAEGGSSLDAVELAVTMLEDDELFNAGKGSVFTADGIHEMDACIMNGADLNAGAVAGVVSVKNPIQLAREVMINSEHVLLAGQGAEAFARLHGFEEMPLAYFYDDFRFAQWERIKDTDKVQLDHSPVERVEDKFGTVGAVATDERGNVAAATSTGGMTNKKYGRIGDSPIAGIGNYANNKTCAVSCTGHGEFFIRGVVAYDVSCLMEYKNMSLMEASDHVINERMLKIGGDGGLIAVNSEGEIAMPFNSSGMYRASRTQSKKSVAEIYK
jgi:beta-aspartyl-peptidase (threonine type)